MKDKTFEKLLGIVAEQLYLSDEEAAAIDMDTAIEDLSANWDSIAAVELALTVEEEFGIKKITEEDWEKLHTVEDMVDFVISRMD